MSDGELLDLRVRLHRAAAVLSRSRSERRDDREVVDALAELRAASDRALARMDPAA